MDLIFHSFTQAKAFIRNLSIYVFNIKFSAILLGAHIHVRYTIENSMMWRLLFWFDMWAKLVKGIAMETHV